MPSVSAAFAVSVVAELIWTVVGDADSETVGGMLPLPVPPPPPPVVGTALTVSETAVDVVVAAWLSVATAVSE